jgi:hypothetical protein
MKFSNLFSQFIDAGTKPASTQESSALLDEARSVILDLARRVDAGPTASAGPQLSRQAAKAAQSDLEKAAAAMKAARPAASSKPQAKDRFGRTAAEPMPPKPAPKAAPAPAPASKTPIADRLATLQGAERTAFYQKNERAIRLEALRASSPGSITPES